METIIVNPAQWQELIQKIDRINTFVEQAMAQQPTEENAWLNDEETCEYLSISSRTLHRLRKSGDLSYSTVAQKYYYKKSEIGQLMERRSVKSKNERLSLLKANRKNK